MGQNLNFLISEGFEVDLNKSQKSQKPHIFTLVAGAEIFRLEKDSIIRHGKGYNPSPFGKLILTV